MPQLRRFEDPSWSWESFQLIPVTAHSALPRRITMGMDDMFNWKTKANGTPKRSIEMSGAYDGGLSVQTHGLMAGTKVASNLGWRSIEALTVGDSVLTFDNGMQEITEVRRQIFWMDAPDTAAAAWPVYVPVGALDNREEMILMADQGVVVESDGASDAFGDPFAMVPAHTLEGVRGIIRAAPAEQIELIAIYFAQPQVIYAEGGALIHCPTNTVSLDAFLNADADAYAMLSPRDAAFVAECLVVEDQMLATGGWSDGQTAARC
ncbi:Hint domain-containing protein [Sulfitobacter sp. F26204]|nr:Hint domain-containing protein [Sulfitobacter sp. F26204]